MSGLRLFGWYALASAVPIALLGWALADLYRTQMDRRALEQATSEAEAVANAGIEPILEGHDLGRPLGDTTRAELAATTAPLLDAGSALRLRLRDRSGVVVFDAAHPARGREGGPDEEAEEAASGEVVRKLTRLNSDEVDASAEIGARAVEAYVPIHAGGRDERVIGVLEIYLPYEPIAASFAASNHAMTQLLVVGLLGVWLALSAITWSVTRRLRRSAEANEHLALHDALTGLPNRALFQDRAAHAVATAGRSVEPVGIAIIDLDRFKELNDTLGHHNGDAYLRHLATTLAGLLRPGDTIARLGGDEFGLVLPGVDAAAARPILERIVDALSDDVEIEGVPVSSEASIGIAFWPADGSEIADLLQCADVAMYAAKQAHCGILEYSPDLAQYTPARLALMSELRHAITSDELVLHYQPKLDLRSARVDSVEALLRWQHPTRGLLSPGAFLDVAESTGLIDPLTDWVLDRAIAQVARWQREGLDLGVAVNISARNLRDESLPDRVLDLLRRHDVLPERLEIEITETAFVVDPPRASQVLQRLHDHGVRVSLDDFGQGYTSLAQLGRLPLSEVKIDRSFVANMLANQSDHTIVNTVIDLGHNLGLEVVAEGVDTTDVLRALVELGCDTAQGFVLTRALPADELTRWLHRFDPAETTPPTPLAATPT